MDKAAIRKKNLALRSKLNQSEASRKIVSEILRSDKFLCAKNVLIFFPMKNEISLLSLMKSELAFDKKFFLPRVDGENLLICPFEGELVKSSFNVMEPISPCVAPSIIDIAFIPCLAIDKNLNRVGFGKGFYDRLFSNSDFKALKVAVINKELTHDLIEADLFDKKVDFVITD